MDSLEKAVVHVSSTFIDVENATTIFTALKPRYVYGFLFKAFPTLQLKFSFITAVVLLSPFVSHSFIQH